MSKRDGPGSRGGGTRASAPPPRALRLLFFACVALSILPALFGLHYARGYWNVRAGKSIAEQRASLLGVNWFRPAFTSFLDRLDRTLPPQSHVLIEPVRAQTTAGRSRWHLFLNHYAYPHRFYTRQSAWASGTLVDYPRWIEHHQRSLGLEQRLADEAAIRERGIDWILRIPIGIQFRASQVELFKRGASGWERVDLAPPRAGAEGADDWQEPTGGLLFDSGQAESEPEGP